MSNGNNVVADEVTEEITDTLITFIYDHTGEEVSGNLNKTSFVSHGPNWRGKKKWDRLAGQSLRAAINKKLWDEDAAETWDRGHATNKVSAATNKSMTSLLNRFSDNELINRAWKMHTIDAQEYIDEDGNFDREALVEAMILDYAGVQADTE